MLDGLRQFIADVVSPHAHDNRAFDDSGYRLAATALLIHVISLDGEPTDTERRKLHSLIESRFGLDPGTADQLIASATLVEGEAVDLYHFTSVIMRQVDEEGRLRIVEMMWETVKSASSRTMWFGARPICSAFRRATGSNSSTALPPAEVRPFREAERATGGWRPFKAIVRRQT